MPHLPKVNSKVTVNNTHTRPIINDCPADEGGHVRTTAYMNNPIHTEPITVDS